MSHPIYAAPIDVSKPARQEPTRRDESFDFKGNTGEYFRIWIVNVLLTLLTLGVYSAWAKVRTRQYFYRNTFLDEVSFEYLADPIKILKGRILIAVALGSLAATQFYSPALYAVGLLLLLVATPWVVVKAHVFNARYSAYRNIRFAFKGSVGEAYGVFGLCGLVYLVTLGLAAPYVNFRITQFVANAHLYGAERFEFRRRAGEYFRVYLVALAMMIGIIVVLGVTLSATFGLSGGGDKPNPAALLFTMVLFYGLLIFPAAYIKAHLANLLYDGLRVGPHRLRSAQKPLEVLQLYLVNAVAVVASLGLAVPWAKIRMAQYRASRTGAELVGDVDVMALEGERDPGAYGDAAADLGDFDLDLG